MSLARRAAAALEGGRWDGPLARAVASAVGPLAARALVRPDVIDAPVAVVCVGGATLGGSGKTRVALAATRSLVAAGARPAFVGHGHRGRIDRARRVRVDDDLRDVGDEALVCARALASVDVPVLVAPTRRDAIALALEAAPDVLVVDGPLRFARTRGPSLALLAVDEARPWGSGRLPPAGDLRAPRAALERLADHVVAVPASPTEARLADGTPASLDALGRHPIGLFTAMARPERLLHALRTRGIVPHAAVSVADHGPLDARAIRRMRAARVETWLATDKCALHLAGVRLGVPVVVLSSVVAVGAEVDRALAALVASATGGATEGYMPRSAGPGRP